MSWYTLYRPDCLDDIEGNADIKEKVSEYIDNPTIMPNTLMFTGESGTGKTTFGRIIAIATEAELEEINCANIRGLDQFREIISKMAVIPLGGKRRVVILDEAHKLPKGTQELLLKPLEDGWSHTTMIICTTDPNKLIKTVRTRPVTFNCESLDDECMRRVIRRVCKEEEVKLKKTVVAKLIEASDGSSRQALTILESIAGLSPELMLKKIKAFNGDTPEEVITLCRLLMSNNPQWKKVAELVKKLEGEPETIRLSVFGYAMACLPNAGPKAYKIADAFRDNYYDVGKHGPMLSAYEACH
jgi:DNA polymerase-3 subunit gamma/tau